MQSNLLIYLFALVLILLLVSNTNSAPSKSLASINKRSVVNQNIAAKPATQQKTLASVSNSNSKVVKAKPDSKAVKPSSSKVIKTAPRLAKRSIPKVQKRSKTKTNNGPTTWDWD